MLTNLRVQCFYPYAVSKSIRLQHWGVDCRWLFGDDTQAVKEKPTTLLAKGKINGSRVTVYRRTTTFMDTPPVSNGICRKWGNNRYIISIRPGLSPKKELEVLIHELLHAADWSKDEEWVEDVAFELVRFITQILPEKGTP